MLLQVSPRRVAEDHARRVLQLEAPQQRRDVRRGEGVLRDLVLAHALERGAGAEQGSEEAAEGGEDGERVVEGGGGGRHGEEGGWCSPARVCSYRAAGRWLVGHRSLLHIQHSGSCTI